LNSRRLFGTSAARVGREEPDRVVAPVVDEALLEEVAVIDERVDRQQLDRRDAEALHVVHHLLPPEARVGAAQVLGNGGVELREAADVGLVHDGVVPRHARAAGLTLPVEVGIDDHRARHERRAVALVERAVVHRLHLVAEHRGVPAQRAGVGARVRIEQQLVRIEAVAAVRLVRAVDAIAVERAGPDVGQVAVPDLVGELGQRDPLELLLAAGVEEADLDLRRVRREEREVDALAVPRRSARIR
jgi:hypothetical protein